jgi:hypothetical protein
MDFVSEKANTKRTPQRRDSSGWGGFGRLPPHTHVLGCISVRDGLPFFRTGNSAKRAAGISIQAARHVNKKLRPKTFRQVFASLQRERTGLYFQRPMIAEIAAIGSETGSEGTAVKLPVNSGCVLCGGWHAKQSAKAAEFFSTSEIGSYGPTGWLGD